MRIVNWNIEWMNDWFVGGGQVAFRHDNPGKGITDVADLCRRVASVLQTLQPDAVTIEEGPSDIREMQLFVDTYLLDAQGNPLFDIFGGLDGGAQKIYTLVKRGGELRNPAIAMDPLATALQDPWESDIDGDCQLEGYEFTRQPLVLQGTVGDEGPALKIVTLHTKSKYVHGGKEKWENPATRMEFVRAALKNRRRISSEGMRVRGYLNDLVREDSNSIIFVTGDFNDGPGIDYFERNYLTHNVTDILLGSTYYPDLLFRHPLVERVPVGDRYTAIFDDFIDEVQGRRLLLDHVLTSPAAAPSVQGAGIAHPEYNGAIDAGAPGRQGRPSDHRPIYVDF